MSKICPKCLESRHEDDFFHDICFRCKYKEKVKPTVKRSCKLCDKSIKNNGSIYCSVECKDLAKARQQRNHWTKRIISHSDRW